MSCNRLGSGLSLHLYKHLHPLLLTCGLPYSAAKLVNSCNQIAVLLTACTKMNNTSIFQCPAGSLMTLLALRGGTLSDRANSGTTETIVSASHVSCGSRGQGREGAHPHPAHPHPSRRQAEGFLLLAPCIGSLQWLQGRPSPSQPALMPRARSTAAVVSFGAVTDL